MAMFHLFDNPLPVIAAAIGSVSDPLAASLTSSDQKLASANTKRTGGSICNSGSSTAYVRFGTSSATAAAGGYHWAIPANTIVPLPDAMTLEIHVCGPSLAPSGVVTLTELVAP